MPSHRARARIVGVRILRALPRSRPSSPLRLTVLLLVERAVAATTAEGVRLGVTLTAVESQPGLFSLKQLQLLTKREYPV